MAGTEGDIIQLTLSALNLSQVQENVHFYRLGDGSGATYLEGLCNQFETEVLPLYAAVQNTSVDYIQLTARNIFNGDEYVLSPLDPVAGTIATEPRLASFMSANIKLVRSNARVRHGRKSIGGATEAQSDGQQWVPDYVSALQDLADMLATELVAGLIDAFAPVIVGRVFVPADPPEIPNAYYRLPTSQVEMGDKWANVVSGLASSFITTQRSRKLGHGS